AYLWMSDECGAVKFFVWMKNMSPCRRTLRRSTSAIFTDAGLSDSYASSTERGASSGGNSQKKYDSPGSLLSYPARKYAVRVKSFRTSRYQRDGSGTYLITFTVPLSNCSSARRLYANVLRGRESMTSTS